MSRVAKGMTVAKALVGTRNMENAIKETIKNNLKGKKLFESIKTGQNIEVKKGNKKYKGKVECKTKNIIVISDKLFLRSLSINDLIANDYIITIL